jgi:acetylornithine deacetylase
MPVSDPAPPDPVDLLRSWIAIPSLSTEEEALADAVEARVRGAGVGMLRHENNVAFWVGEGDDTLLFNTHLDVVPPAADPPFDPFDPVVEDGVCYGRGSVDAKASGAAMTTALLALAARGWRPQGGRLMVALTACEEGGGAYNGLQSLRPHLPPIGSAVVGEPTSLAPCIAQRGLLVLKVHARGRAAHAGRPHLGDNAIVRAAEAIRAIKGLSIEGQDPLLGAPSATVTTIEGGTARNAVPDACTFAVDVRTTPAFDQADALARVRSALEAIDGVEIEVHSDRFVPCATAPDARIARACRDALDGVDFVGSPTASDWIFLEDRPVVKLGPGESERSHTAGECIPVAEVRRAAAAYARAARRYFELDAPTRDAEAAGRERFVQRDRR